MTTFKTFVIAAMMTVFGATATLANNNVHKNNNHMPAPAVEMHIHGKHHNKCHCRTCEEIRFRKEMKRLHRNTRGPVRGCHCPKCEDMRYHMSHPAHHTTKPAGSYRH